MKIPTSSSIILATLAVSSSSSCLAAPTGADAHEAGMASSPSYSTSSPAYPTGADAQEFPMHLRSRDDTVVGDLWQKVVGQLDASNSAGGQGISAQSALPLNPPSPPVNPPSPPVGPPSPPVNPPSPPVNPPSPPVNPPSPPVNPPSPPVNPPSRLVNPPFPIGKSRKDDGSGNSADPAVASSSAPAPGPSESAASYGLPTQGGAPPSPNAPPAPPPTPDGI